MIQTSTHLRDELLESYVSGQLNRESVTSASEHLFECEDCFRQYQAEVDFQLAFRAASLQEDVRTVAATSSRPLWLQWPAAAALTMATLVGAAVFIPRMNTGSDIPVAAVLTAVRNGDVVSVRSNRSVELHLDATGLASNSSVRVQLADQHGAQVWRGDSKVKDGKWTVLVPVHLQPGRYWVRIFVTDTDEQLREYPLEVKN